MIIPLLLCTIFGLSSTADISLNLDGENLYIKHYSELTYLLLLPEKIGIIKCSVTNSDTVPELFFTKGGAALSSVLPSSLYELKKTDVHDDGKAYTLKLFIGAGTYKGLEGDWQCVAKNAVRTTRYSFKTIYTGKPSVQFSPPLNAGIARESTTVTMTCNCDFMNQLSKYLDWSWSVDGSTPISSKISYINSNDEGEPTSQMMVRNLDALDSTIYSCSCKLGKLEFRALDTQMTVMSPPGIVRNIQLAETSMDSLSFNWTTSRYMGVVLEYLVAYKVETRNAYKEISTGGSENNYTLSNLKPVTRYNIKIAAKNNAGSGQYSEEVSFMTGQPSEAKPSLSTTNGNLTEDGFNTVPAVEGTDVKLTCKVASYPPAAVSWYFNNERVNGKLSPENFLEDLYQISALEEEHILRIEPANNRNNGVYKCVATNSLGTSRLSFSLQVTEEGKAIRNNSSFLSGSLLLLLTCLLYLNHH